MSKVIAIGIQKGGTGKTQTTVNLGADLVRKGKKVLLIDADPQSSLTVSLGITRPDLLEETLCSAMEKIIAKEEIVKGYGIIHHQEGMDLMPCNLTLAAMDLKLFSVMRREYILKRYIDMVKDDYDYVLIDCPPSMGLLSLNIYTAVDSVLIPVETSYLALSGLELLMSTLSQIKEELNSRLQIEGILITKFNARTTNAQVIYDALYEAYIGKVPFFRTVIPEGVKAKEAPVKGISIFKYSPRSKVAKAYEDLTKEVLGYVK